MHAFGGIFVALREKIGLEKFQVLDGRRVLVDNDVVDALERGEVHGAQVLGNERAEVRLIDVRVGGQADDEQIGVLARIHQMADVPRMHQIEGAVAHDDLLASRARSDRLKQLFAGLDLAAEAVLRGSLHAVFPSRNANQFFVALAIDVGSQTGACRQ